MDFQLPRILVYLFLLFALIPVRAQQLTQTIKGRVIDQQSHSPVIGATVVVADSNPLLGGTTDQDGYFRIREVPVGRQTLQISSVGYESKVIPNILVNSAKETIIEVTLAESLVEMEAVEVVAGRTEKGQVRNDMATVSATSLSVEEISRYPATFGDPARAALSQAGVTTGGDDLLNEIVIRGNTPKGILWRMEGIEIPNPNHFANIGSSAGGISMLSTSVLSNSDFFTAAFPAQYGNVTSGIFDLKMRNGNFDQHEHSFEAGILGIAASSEGPFHKSSNASYLANYRYSTLALTEQLGLDILGNQESVTFQDLSYKVNIPTGKAGTFSLWGLGGRNTYTNTPTKNQFDYEYERNLHVMGAAGLTHMAYLDENTYVESIAAMTGYSIRNDFDSLRIRVLRKESVTEGTFRLSSYLNRKVGPRHNLRIGGIVSHLNFNLRSREWIRPRQRYYTILDEQGSTRFYQSFAQWQYRLTESFTLNSGVHFSHFALNRKSYLEPRAGFRWQLDPRHAITGGFGMHSRMETVSLYMARREQSDSSTIQPNRNLGFTRALHGVLGYERSLGQNLRFKTEIYYQQLYDVPVWPLDTGSNYLALTYSAINNYDGYTIFSLANKGTGQNYGLEFTLEKFLSHGYYFMTTASLYQSTYKGIDGISRPTAFNGHYIFNVVGGKEFRIGGSENQVLGINARLIYAGGKREAPIDLQGSRAFGETVRDFEKNFEVRLEDYKRFDIGVSYRRNRVKTASVISVNIQNVFAIENVYGKFYSPVTDSVFSATQLGMFPNLSYKIEF